jgi:hypothetical protein
VTLLPEKKSRAHSVRIWVNPRDDLDDEDKSKILFPTGIRSPDIPAHSLFAMPSTILRFPRRKQGLLGKITPLRRENMTEMYLKDMEWFYLAHDSMQRRWVLNIRKLWVP